MLHAWLLATILACAAWAAQAEEPPPAEPAPSQTAGQIGRSIFVANEVNGKSGDAPPQRLAINDDIVFGEDISTGNDAKTIIEFRDGSTFEIGPDAVVRIDAFVFNPEESTSHKSLQVTRGVFRYISGYVASDQDTKIAMPGGQMGIRGSVAEGAIDPEIPDFIFVGEGVATFTNGAGSTELQPGTAIAVPSAATKPMPAAAMPPAVAAQALQVIEKRLPPREALANRPAPSETWLRATGAANLVPAAEQQRAITGVPTRPLPGATPRGSLAGELGLLVEANRLNLFHGGPSPRTPEQTAFINRAAHENPGAAANLRRFTTQAGVLRTASTTAGTALVIRGVARAAPSPEVVHRVTASAVRANPAAAPLITRTATEPFRGAPGGGPLPSHPTTQMPAEHPPLGHTPPGNIPATPRTPFEQHTTTPPQGVPGRPPLPPTGPTTPRTPFQQTPATPQQVSPRPGFPPQTPATPQATPQQVAPRPGFPPQTPATPQQIAPRPGFPPQTPATPQQIAPRPGFPPQTPATPQATPQQVAPRPGFPPQTPAAPQATPRPGFPPQLPPRGVVPRLPVPPKGGVVPAQPAPPKGAVTPKQPPAKQPPLPPKKKNPDDQQPQNPR
jgi:hypothetical protein